MDYSEYIGKRYGKVTILGILPAKNQKRMVLGKCDCGNIREFRLSDLKSGNTSSCGKCSIYEMIGKKYNHLTVLSYEGPSSDGHRMFKCKCDCGNEIVVSGTRLRNDKIKSCGKCHPTDEIGKQYGFLTVINYGYTNNQQNYWKCSCICGNITYVTTGHLHSGHTTSCGCIKSRGEKMIQDILTKLNIQYKREYTFEDLKNKKKLRFDFAIEEPSLKLIEFDGEQHFYSSDGWGGEEKLEYIRSNDMMKNTYCLERGIPLLRIKYTINPKEVEEKIKEFLGV